jgi:hypothetical protein
MLTTAFYMVSIYFIAQVVTIAVIYLCSPPTAAVSLFLTVTMNNVIVFLTCYLAGLKKILEKDVIDDEDFF